MHTQVLFSTSVGCVKHIVAAKPRQACTGFAASLLAVTQRGSYMPEKIVPPIRGFTVE